MSEQKFATTLDDAYSNFEVETPVPSASSFYVARKGKGISKLKRRLAHPSTGIVPRYFFSGHTGCGKSTELLQLLADPAIMEKYWALRFSIYDYFPSHAIDYKDLLFFLAIQLFKNYQENGNGKIKKEKQLLKEIEKWQGDITKEIITQEKDRTGMALEAKINAVFAEVVSKFSVEPHTRVIVRQVIDMNINDLIGIINTLGSSIQAGENKPVLVLVDDLDKLSLSSSRQLFIEEGRTLLKINLPIVYTVSSALFYDPSFPTSKIKNIFLPNITLHEEGRPDGRVAEGYVLLKNFVHARMDAKLISEDALDLAIKMSGGVFRELVRIMQEAIDYAQGEEHARVEVEDVEQSVTDIRNMYWRILTKKQVEILESVRAGESRHDPEEMAVLLKMLAVLEYNGRGTWFDVHPALYKLLDEFKKEEALRQSRAS